jgi:putative endopeptidase
VPAAYGSWSAFRILSEHNHELLHELLEAAAAEPGPQGSPTRLVGDYYAAGMDEAAIAAAGVEPLRPYLDRIDALTDRDGVRALLLELRLNGIDFLFGLGPEADFDDSNRYLAYLGQGGLGLPERDYYLRDDERSVELRDAYLRHVALQLGNLGAAEDEAGAAAEAIMAFEHRLAEASYPAEKLRDPTVTLNRYAVADLDTLMPGFALAGHVRGAGVDAPSVCVDNPGFFSALDETLASTPIESIRDYLRWHLIRQAASSLPEAFETEAFNFYGRILGGRREQHPRWRRVLDAATADIGEPVGRLYAGAAFSPQAKERCEHLVDHLRGAMGRAIENAAWMTEPTRQQALTKLSGFGRKIGYPDKWRDYSGLQVDRTSFVGNRIAAAAFEYRRVMGRLDQPVDRDEWEMPAHFVNAYYHPLRNEIVFPAGILQAPFFYPDADEAVNYGGIGTVIGHEITHGFDDSGSRFDAQGHFRNWWSDEDRAEFERRAQVVVEQFNAYTVDGDLHVNGQLTLGENIADLGGVAIALDALHDAIGDDRLLIDGLTQEQRFFLAYAAIWRTNDTPEYARLQVQTDPHAPARYRVNGPLSNIPELAEAFDIPDGSPMTRAREARAKVW